MVGGAWIGDAGFAERVCKGGSHGGGRVKLQLVSLLTAAQRSCK